MHSLINKYEHMETIKNVLLLSIHLSVMFTCALFFIIVYQCHDSVNFGNKLGSVLVRDEQSQNEIFVVDNKLKIGSSN